jgi:hypothetical protein
MYSSLDASQPIRQGDIFRYLPKMVLPLGPAKLPLVFMSQDENSREVDWIELAEGKKPAFANVGVEPVMGIVLTQDCDAIRCDYIAFAEILPFKKLFIDFKPEKTSLSFVHLVTTQTQKNLKWYYLAESVSMGFDVKMCVSFHSVFEVQREMLDEYKEWMRLGRLDDDVAWPHFRERVAEFFRRYPYNEWYPLNAEEVKAYEDDKKKKDPSFQVEPRYYWQKG